MCRHTEASVCRNCPAKQRAEDGRQLRADEPRCDPQEYNNKRRKIYNFYKPFMTEESFQDADDATSWAGVGKKVRWRHGLRACCPLPRAGAHGHQKDHVAEGAA